MRALLAPTAWLALSLAGCGGATTSTGETTTAATAQPPRYTSAQLAAHSSKRDHA